MGLSPARPASEEHGGSGRGDRIRRVVVALACLVILGYMTYEAFGFGVEPRRAPLVVGVPTTIMCLVLVIRELRGTEPVAAAEESAALPAPGEVAAASLPPDVGPDQAESEQKVGAPAPAAEDQLTTLGAATWIGVLSVMFLLFGFLITTLLFPVLFMRLYGKERWRTIAITSVSVFVVTYVFFVIVLEIQIYRGMIAIPGLDGLL